MHTDEVHALSMKATGGDAVLLGARAEHLEIVIDKLRAAGAKVEAVEGGLRVSASGRLKAQGFHTTEYPGFPTDMQAQFMAVMCLAEGVARSHRDDLREPLHARALESSSRLGADIKIRGKLQRSSAAAQAPHRRRR